jgi:hypothetical protein
VFKLNSVKPSDFSDNSQPARKCVRDLFPWHRLWEPVYTWQGAAAFKQEESTNCLGLADTRRFVSFLQEANKKNWATALLNGEEAAGALRFRDDPDCVRLSKSLRKVRRMTRPCVYRMWQ